MNKITTLIKLAKYAYSKKHLIVTISLALTIVLEAISPITSYHASNIAKIFTTEKVVYQAAVEEEPEPTIETPYDWLDKRTLEIYADNIDSKMETGIMTIKQAVLADAQLEAHNELVKILNTNACALQPGTDCKVATNEN